MGEERQGLLEPRIEQAFGSQELLAAFELGQQRPLALWRDLAELEGELAAGELERRLGMHDDA